MHAVEKVHMKKAMERQCKLAQQEESEGSRFSEEELFEQFKASQYPLVNQETDTLTLPTRKKFFFLGKLSIQFPRRSFLISIEL